MAGGSSGSRKSATEALAKVREITGIRPPAELPVPECTIVESIELQDQCKLQKLIIRPEEGISLPALAFLPKEPSGEAYLYLHADGKQADAGPDGPIEKLFDQGHVVLAVDLRGMGETATGKPSTRGIAHHIGPQWKEFYLAYLLGTSFLAMRTEDIVVSARFLADYEAAEKPHRVHLIGVGRVGPPALHAAALEPGLFASVSLRGGVGSWASVVRSPLAVNQFENVVHGALKTYDLPDLAATMPAAKLSIAEPLDPTAGPE